MDPLSEFAAHLDGEPIYLNLGDDLYGLGVPCDPTLSDFDFAIADAFCARANERVARGEYHLAITDYGRALNTSPRNYGFQSHPTANDGRCTARDNLDWFFACGGDPEKLPAGTPDSVRDAVRIARLPSGYLVVAEGGGLLGAYPQTDDGLNAAITHADALATDSEARSRIDNLYLAESDWFDAVVYKCENNRTIEVYRASPQEPASEVVGKDTE